MHLAISPNSVVQFNLCANDYLGTVSMGQLYIPIFIVIPHCSGIAQLLNRFTFQVIASFAELGTSTSATY